MIKWWEREWRLVLFAILAPVLLVPLIGVLLFPETPLIDFFLYGLIFSILIAQIVRIVRDVEIWGSKLAILIFGGIALFALILIIILKRL